MTKESRRKDDLILAITPSSRGFGFALLEGGGILVDWGVKSVTGIKNADALKKAEEMISLYQPDQLVLEDADATGSRRSLRIRELTQQIVAAAKRRKLRVILLSRQQVRQAFFEDGQGSKHALARILALRFPDELGHRLPPKRKPWMTEDYRMGIFDAVALAVGHRLRQNK